MQCLAKLELKREKEAWKEGDRKCIVEGQQGGGGGGGGVTHTHTRTERYGKGHAQAK